VLDKKHFEDIQSSIKGKLLELANQSRYPLDYITSVTEGCDFVVSASSPSEPFSPTIWIDSKTPETPALIALWLHLAGAGVAPERIRVCALQDCKNLYLVNRKPRKDKENFYCSVRCARNAATRQWREIHKDELRVKERKRGRPRYEASNDEPKVGLPGRWSVTLTASLRP